MITISKILERFTKRRKRLVKEEGKPDYHVHEVHDSHNDSWVPITTLLATEHFVGHDESVFNAIPEVEHDNFSDGFQGGASGGGGAERSFDSPSIDTSSIDSSFDIGSSDIGGAGDL